MLDSSSCFVLDCGADVWVWAGVYCSTSEKSWAMLKVFLFILLLFIYYFFIYKYSITFIKHHNANNNIKAEELVGHGRRPESAAIIWVVDGAETLLFRENFVDWYAIIIYFGFCFFFVFFLFFFFL
jgi:hypothetical protein